MVYYTGDTHGDFKKIVKFVRDNKLTAQDVVVILGDAGFNYFLDIRDEYNKEYVNNLGISIFCVHGNHEARPQTIPSYKQTTWNGGKVYKEWKYPNLLFAVDGEVYNLDGKNSLVIGGAYSVDKHYRLMRGMRWFSDEQPSEETKETVRAWMKTHDKVDQILSHTCPFKYEPVEAFLPMIDQSTVDTSTEEFLDEVESLVEYSRWLCGHWHIDKQVDKLRFVMNDFIT